LAALSLPRCDAMPVIGQFLWPRRPLSEVFGNGLGPKRSVHFSSASRSENTLLPFPTHDNHGLQGSIMQSTFSAAARVTGGRQGKWAWKARRCAKSELG